MSVTYTSLLLAVNACFVPGEATLSLTTSAPVQARSTKAVAGSGAKVVATLRDLNLTMGGAGAEHGDSPTRGTLTFSLRSSRATNEVTIDSLSALAELGHRCVIRLDGSGGGIRANVAGVRFTAEEVVFNVALNFGHHVDSQDTDELLAGRV